MKKYFVLFCALLGSFKGWTQPLGERVPIDSLVSWSSAFSSAPNELDRRKALFAFNEEFSSYVRTEPTPEEMEKLKPISKLVSKDGELEIYTWVFPRAGGVFEFYGWMKYAGQWTELIDSSGRNEEGIEYHWMGSQKWYGAYYYGIVTTQNKEGTFYNLLGFRPRLQGYQEKVIEPVKKVETISEFRWGAPIFNTPIIEDIRFKRKPYRLVFRYSPEHNASLRYLDKEDMILVDHLAPPDASQQKQWKHYGPDFSYDGLEWVEGAWILQNRVTFDSPIVTPQRGENIDQGLQPPPPPPKTK